MNRFIIPSAALLLTLAAASTSGQALAGDELYVGSTHSCALMDTGAVRCWGMGNYGQLGYGNTTTIGDDEDPIVAGDVNLGGTAVRLALGTYHSCALLDTGAVRCWGNASYGELGYGNTQRIGDNEDPADAGDVPLGGLAVDIAAGAFHNCALMDTGAVRCWGSNGSGRLGYGQSTNGNVGDSEPASTWGDVPLGGTAVQIAAGGQHSCALLDTGAVRCWGNNSYGQLGYGNTQHIGDNEAPSAAGDVPLGEPALKISTGDRSTCALLEGGAVRCWGYGWLGANGNASRNTYGDNEPASASPLVGIPGAAVDVEVVGYHACALLDTGAVHCWGQGVYGRLGLTYMPWAIGDTEYPEEAVTLPADVISLAQGHGSSMCALRANGDAYCWGFNYYGNLGYGHKDLVGDNEAVSSQLPVLYR